jgi:hypothetical protein
MTHRSRWSCILSACVLALALSVATVDAADKTKVDQATKQVEQGARQIGQGELGTGFKDMFIGIGMTIFEGAKFSGNTIGEFFQRTFGT